MIEFAFEVIDVVEIGERCTIESNDAPGIKIRFKGRGQFNVLALHGTRFGIVDYTWKTRSTRMLTCTGDMNSKDL